MSIVIAIVILMLIWIGVESLNIRRKMLRVVVSMSISIIPFVIRDIAANWDISRANREMHASIYFISKALSNSKPQEIKQCLDAYIERTSNGMAARGAGYMLHKDLEPLLPQPDYRRPTSKSTP